MAGNKYLLKIIAGPNAGAEIALGQEELLVGSTPECDLILSDSLVSSEHMKLTVTEEGVKVAGLQGEVYVAGDQISEECTLEDFQFVSLGTTHFVVGPVEGQWPPLTSADVPNLVRAEVPEEQEAEAAEEENLSEEEKNPVDEEKPSSEQVEASVEDAEEEATGVNPMLFVFVGVAVLLLFGVGGVGAYFLLGGKEEVQALVQEELMTPEVVTEKVRKSLAGIGVEDDFVIENDGARVIITGWVKNELVKQEVEDSISYLADYVRTDIWNQENILSEVNNVVSDLRAPVKMEGMEPGKIKLTGYYGNELGWEQIKGKINEVQGVKLIVDEVITGDKIRPIIESVIEQFSLEGKIQGEPMVGYVAIKGVINDKDTEGLKKMVSALRSRLGSAVPFKNEVVIAETEKVFVQLDIETVVVGEKNGYVVTKGGERLFEGGLLKGGYTIERIDRAGIVLRKGKQTITLNIGGK